jgi:hypothetical protein
MASQYISLPVKQNSTGTNSVIVTSSALPTGAATSAKQPALGVAGTPSTDVLTVQGAVTMTALKVDGSAVTQPVSGTVTTLQQQYATRLDEISTTVNYIGSAPVGSATSSATWLIKRLTVSGTQTIIQFASASYNQVWDNRASLTYT